MTIAELLVNDPNNDLLDALYECQEIKDEIYDQRRWHTCHEYIVFEKETGKFYRYYMQLGNTEYQENEDFSKDDVHEVEPIEEMVKITKYVAV